MRVRTASPSTPRRAGAAAASAGGVGRSGSRADAASRPRSAGVVPSSPISSVDSPTALDTRPLSTSSSSSSAAAPVVPTLTPFLEETSSPFSWLYQPHTVTGLVVVVAVVVYFAFLAEPVDSLDAIRRRGIACACAVFLAYCALQLRDSLLLRPHPALWRVVHGLGLLYLMGLVYLLAFPADDARRLLQILHADPENASLGSGGGVGGIGGVAGAMAAAPGMRGGMMDASDVPLTPPPHNSKSYASDCRVYTPGDPGGPFARVTEAIDLFVVAHFVGWWAKAVMLRDWRLAWSLSVLWELVEMSLQGVLPNFAECWWDHWVLDFLVCNGLGIVAGMATVRLLALYEFDWSGREAASPLPRNPLRQAARLLRQFAPINFVRYEWGLFDSFRNLLAAFSLVALLEVVELNAFFLKFVLYLPPENPLNAWRLAFWFAMSLPATREYYAYVVEERNGGKGGAGEGPGGRAVGRGGVKPRRRMGPNLWLAVTLAAVEVAVCAKYAASTVFPGWGIPRSVVIAWGVAAACFGAWATLRFVLGGGGGGGNNKGGRTPPGVMNALVAASCLALAHIAWEQDVGVGSG
jgi:phosphatidylserine synthase 2